MLFAERNFKIAIVNNDFSSFATANAATTEQTVFPNMFSHS